jgi:hypothetical protein
MTEWCSDCQHSCSISILVQYTNTIYTNMVESHSVIHHVHGIYPGNYFKFQQESWSDIIHHIRLVCDMEEGVFQGVLRVVYYKITIRHHPSRPYRQVNPGGGVTWCQTCTHVRKRFSKLDPFRVATGGENSTRFKF